MFVCVCVWGGVGGGVLVVCCLMFGATSQVPCVHPWQGHHCICCVKSVYVRCVPKRLSAFLFVCTYGLCVGLCSLIYVCVCVCACTCLLLAGARACTLMMEIIRNFLQLGRWRCFFGEAGGGGAAAGWVGCEWVR